MALPSFRKEDALCNFLDYHAPILIENEIMSDIEIENFCCRSDLYDLQQKGVKKHNWYLLHLKGDSRTEQEDAAFEILSKSIDKFDLDDYASIYIDTIFARKEVPCKSTRNKMKSIIDVTSERDSSSQKNNSSVHTIYSKKTSSTPMTRKNHHNTNDDVKGNLPRNDSSNRNHHGQSPNNQYSSNFARSHSPPLP